VGKSKFQNKVKLSVAIYKKTKLIVKGYQLRFNTFIAGMFDYSYSFGLLALGFVVADFAAVIVVAIG
jgi:hypothetical protein